MDETVNYLHDSRDVKVNSKLEKFPVLKPLWIYHPANRRWLCRTLAFFVPAGGIIYLLSIPYCRRLVKEFEAVESASLEELRIVNKS